MSLRSGRLLATLCLVGISLFVTFRKPPSAYAGEPQWMEIRSPHFSVVTDAGEKRGREVAMRFEQMRAVFGRCFSVEALVRMRKALAIGPRNESYRYNLANRQPDQAIALLESLRGTDDPALASQVGAALARMSHRGEGSMKISSIHQRRSSRSGNHSRNLFRRPSSWS